MWIVLIDRNPDPKNLDMHRAAAPEMLVEMMQEEAERMFKKMVDGPPKGENFRAAIVREMPFFAAICTDGAVFYGLAAVEGMEEADKGKEGWLVTLGIPGPDILQTGRTTDQRFNITVGQMMEASMGFSRFMIPWLLMSWEHILKRPVENDIGPMLFGPQMVGKG